MYFDKMRLSGLNTVELPIIGITTADEFVLRNVDGLAPTPKNVEVSKGRVKNLGHQDREIVMQIGLNPDYSLGNTPADLRSYMYALLVGEMNVEFLQGSTVVLTTVGEVSVIENSMWTKDPVVQVTFTCAHHWFEAPDSVHPTLAGLSKTAPVIPNVGDAPTGFRMEIELTESMSEWSLVKADSTAGMFLDNLAALSGDIIEFNTAENERYIRLTRPSTSLVVVLLSNLTSESEWLQLDYPGNNSFVTSDDGFDWEDIEYTPKYLGV